jgi:hypothetical protein
MFFGTGDARPPPVANAHRKGLQDRARRRSRASAGPNYTEQEHQALLAPADLDAPLFTDRSEEEQEGE